MSKRDDYCTVTEAATLLGKSIPTVYRYISTGKLPAIKNPVFGQLMIPKEDILEASEWA